MKLPGHSVIAREKLRDYLLRLRDDHDKARFLALAGCGPASAQRLEADLRAQLLPWEARPAGETAYGEKFIMALVLIGPNARAPRVRSVWIHDKATGLTRFVTRYPEPK